MAAGPPSAKKPAGAKKPASAKKRPGKTAKRRAKRSGAKASADSLELGTDKLYFKIGEVASIVDVAAHVLRYWESEFALIKPQKSRSQQRVYRRKDVENLLRIKHLLYERKFTIAGAKQELRGGASKIERAEVSGLYRAQRSMAQVREQLDLLAHAVRAQPDSGHIAADPAEFVRASGGARSLLAGSSSGDSDARGDSRPTQHLLERPDRPDLADRDR
ncbi:HTH-type transcriptional regulator GlnR [Enhygromyxa salina]|uniref:HTH-type transcriptional regulator GlnR n=1 Tax=Enhygromyxa salina TaxID=215803 RepID=A0A2S9XW73_9BACT|nr:MerR family transcriptional regulator [Enhygromyxa salina]PRP97116.1 HTH-type transcriptional regulator GlnR [Enhygromyxa salina]